MYSWMKVYHEIGGHRLFFDSNSSRYSIADNSGPLPHNTDDGVLWIDENRPFTVYSDTAVCIPVNLDQHVLVSIAFAEQVAEHIKPKSIVLPPQLKRLLRFAVRAL